MPLRLPAPLPGGCGPAPPPLVAVGLPPSLAAVVQCKDQALSMPPITGAGAGALHCHSRAAAASVDQHHHQVRPARRLAGLAVAHPHLRGGSGSTRRRTVTRGRGVGRPAGLANARPAVRADSRQPRQGKHPLLPASIHAQERRCCQAPQQSCKGPASICLHAHERPPPPCPASRHSPAHLEPPDVHPVSHHHHSISQPLITLTTPQQGCVHRAAPAKGGEGEASSSVGQPCRLSGMG